VAIAERIYLLMERARMFGFDPKRRGLSSGWFVPMRPGPAGII
jgi:hypothetical protein